MKRSMASFVFTGSLFFVLAGSLLFGSPALAQPASAAFGFNGSVSGFPTGAVRITGGGAYDLDSGFVHSAGGFRCTSEVAQGPLANAKHDSPTCGAGEGVRWDTAELLTDTIMFKCTGSASEAAKPATTTDKTVVLLADFYRAGDGIDESFTAQMIVSEEDIAPDIEGVQNLWVQGVGCGTGIVHFR